MIQNIDHIGIAVRSLDESVKFYENVLGLKCEAREEIASQNVRIAFFRLGSTRLELIEAASPDCPLAKFLEKRGPGLHHLAFGTNDLNSELKQVAERGCQLVHSTPVPGADRKQVAFLHPNSTQGVLIELCSAQQD